ncbi:MAG: insulinase family protein, partial [Bacteroidaceae bacterium]|nr:insulinase family protein [Bacteroidaceae bacterium]
SEPHQPRFSPVPYQPQYIVSHRDTHQAHVALGGRSFDASQGKRTGLYVVNNLLGGPGMNSRLNLALRERRGLVYNVESNLTNYTDTGTFCIYFGCDVEDVERCLHLCQLELKRLIDYPLTEAQLNAAKRQLKGQLVVACDNFENNILDLAKAYLHYDKVEEMDETYRRIDDLTPDFLQQIATEVFALDRLTVLIYK